MMTYTNKKNFPPIFENFVSREKKTQITHNYSIVIPDQID